MSTKLDKVKPKASRQVLETRNPKTGKLTGSQSLNGVDAPTSAKGLNGRTVKTRPSKEVDPKTFTENALRLVKRGTFPAKLKSGFPKGVNRDEITKVYIKLAKAMSHPHRYEIYEPETRDKMITELIPERTSQKYVRTSQKYVKAAYYKLELQKEGDIERWENIDALESAEGAAHLTFIDDHRYEAIYRAYEWAYNELLEYSGYVWAYDPFQSRTGHWYRTKEAAKHNGEVVISHRDWMRYKYFKV